MPRAPSFNPFEDPLRPRLVADPVSEDWVIIAPGRAHRPGLVSGPSRACRFCPEQLDPREVLAVDERGGHRLTALMNRFPVLGTEDGEPYGRQEIIVEGAQHRSLHAWTLDELDRLFAFYATRMDQAKRDPLIRFVLLFRNQGRDAGASQTHPHAQLYAMQGVSPRLERERSRRAYYRAHARLCPACLTVRETTGGPLAIFEDANAMALANPTGRFAHEVRVLVRRHVGSLSALSPAERRSFARALQACLPWLARERCAFNYYIQELRDDPDQHLELRLAPHENFQGGLELSSGIYVNPVEPAAAARAYRMADGRA